MRTPSLPGLLLGVLLSVSAVADEPSPDSVVATLPFLESEERNRIFVDLAKEDSRRRLRLLLDTGASDSVLTPGAARDAIFCLEAVAGIVDSGVNNFRIARRRAGADGVL